jgi:hypothetical protein
MVWLPQSIGKQRGTEARVLSGTSRALVGSARMRTFSGIRRQIAFEIVLAIAIVLAVLPFAYWGLLAWRLLYD